MYSHAWVRWHYMTHNDWSTRPESEGSDPSGSTRLRGMLLPYQQAAIAAVDSFLSDSSALLVTIDATPCSSPSLWDQLDAGIMVGLMVIGTPTTLGMLWFRSMRPPGWSVLVRPPLLGLTRSSPGLWSELNRFRSRYHPGGSPCRTQALHVGETAAYLRPMKAARRSMPSRMSAALAARQSRMKPSPDGPKVAPGAVATRLSLRKLLEKA